MARQFADVVRELSSGTTYEDITANLSEIVDAVVLHRKTGELTVKLTVRPNGENSVRMIADIKAKVPQAPRAETIFFAAAGGLLTREDPRQTKLPLREVVEEATELKEPPARRDLA